MRGRYTKKQLGAKLKPPPINRYRKANNQGAAAMPSKKQVLKAYLTPEEYGEIQNSASKAGVSLSTFAKRVCLGTQVQSVVDSQAIMALMRTNADLARLGNLLKIALNEEQSTNVEKLIQDINLLREEIKTKVYEIRPL